MFPKFWPLSRKPFNNSPNFSPTNSFCNFTGNSFWNVTSPGMSVILLKFLLKCLFVFLLKFFLENLLEFLLEILLVLLLFFWNLSFNSTYKYVEFLLDVQPGILIRISPEVHPGNSTSLSF